MGLMDWNGNEGSGSGGPDFTPGPGLDEILDRLVWLVVRVLVVGGLIYGAIRVGMSIYNSVSY